MIICDAILLLFNVVRPHRGGVVGWSVILWCYRR